MQKYTTVQKNNRYTEKLEPLDIQYQTATKTPKTNH